MLATVKKKEVRGGRYDMVEIALRVEKLRERRGRTVKDLCDEVGLSRFDWSHKKRMKKSTFSIAELGRIADALDAPPGWPFIPEELGEILSTLRRHA